MGMGCESGSCIIQGKKSPWFVPQSPHFQKKGSAIKASPHHIRTFF